MRLSQQISEALADALAAEDKTQADLARDMGLSAKHVNQMVNGKSGAMAMYDYAAFALSRRWVVTLEYVGEEGEG